MPTPQPSQKVQWRHLRHARALGWVDALGLGPFEVVRVVDKSHQGLPHGLVLQTPARPPGDQRGLAGLTQPVRFPTLPGKFLLFLDTFGGVPSILIGGREGLLPGRGYGEGPR